MPEQSATAAPRAPDGLDLVFQALADPTRRAVVERLGIGPGSTSELARPFQMALPSFIGHLDVLVRSGLITSRKQGRVRTYALAPDRLRDAQAWLAAQEAHWSRRLDQLDALLLEGAGPAQDAGHRPDQASPSDHSQPSPAATDPPKEPS